jgi:coenzyme PQQ precursor peptide PqqA
MCIHFKALAGRELPELFLLACIDFRLPLSYALANVDGSAGNDYLEDAMQWTAPVFEEVCLNCEINSYASAKL